uniref:Metal-dependent protein hydrolase n=1 Tax=Neobodo designis TaxID=312471 RepID=A0A7S1M2K9_NEODS
MACGILHFTQQFARPVIVRSRVPAELEQCTAVVDVGATYEPEKLRLDHHQPEFQGTMDTGRNQYRTRLSSAGLVYRHFGKEIIATLAADLAADGIIAAAPSAAELDLVYDVVYKNFVEHVDGIDNGVEQFSAAAEGAKIVKNYAVPTTLSSRVASLHTRWNEPSSKQKDNEGFAKAMLLCTTEFCDAVEYVLASWLPARSIVEEAVAAGEAVEPSGAIVLMKRFAPWKDHLMDIEKERGIDGRSLYVVFDDGRGGGRVQCVPEADASFKNRKSLPWRGLRDEELSKASGIDGCVFIHASGFIGGNKSMDGAIAMAKKAVAMPADE